MIWILFSWLVPVGNTGLTGGFSYRHGVSLAAFGFCRRLTNRSSLSDTYITQPRINCFSLLRQAAPVAFSLALERAGKSMLARIAMTAMTTRSSISVNARFSEEVPFGGFMDNENLAPLRS